MTGYTETLTVTLPEALAEIASKIGRAIDTDRGGADSFISLGDGTIQCRTPCKPWYKEALLQMQSNPSALHQFCIQDYQTRWSTLTAPTLQECEQFLAAAIIN